MAIQVEVDRLGSPVRWSEVSKAREALIQGGSVDAPDFSPEELEIIVAPTIRERNKFLSSMSKPWLPKKLSSGLHALGAFIRQL
ncbi:hypothetical protein HYU45_00340 [Candidatus Daviesbacteria bacterium]|nr:hypothetical protein [Candidatus Daviesbacteria bacterium]